MLTWFAFYVRSVTLAEDYYSERDTRAESLTTLFQAAATPEQFITAMKGWFGRSDLPGRPPIEMRYLFRGHADSRWGLSSTLYRLLTDGGKQFDEQALREAERAIVRQMRLEGLGHNMTDGELLIVLQHHAIPTRLIDATESPRVALYFACAGQDGVDGRLFVVAQRPARAGEGFPSVTLHDSKLLPWGVKTPRGVFASGRWQETVLCVDDGSLDPRMTAQQGRFLVGGLIGRLPGDGMSVGGRNVSVDQLRHLTTLRVMFPLRGTRKHAGVKWPVLGWTVRVPAQWKQEIRELLAADGITNDSMFPDIDGARRLAHFVARNANVVSQPIRAKARAAAPRRSTTRK